MPFNHLPNEIVEMIFYIHAYNHLESRCCLLLVCRKWFAIATNSTDLWRKISWYDGIECTRDAIKCHSLDALVRNVHRAGNVTLDLTLGMVWDSPSGEEDSLVASLPSSWLSQCRSLRLWSSQDYLFGNPGMMKPLFRGRTFGMMKLLSRGRTFDSLELLELAINDNEVSPSSLHEFCSRIEGSALHLQSLKMGYGGVARIVTQYPLILARISMLVLGYGMPRIPWCQLTALEHLEVVQGVREDRSLLGLADIVAPRLTLLHLRGFYDRNHFPTNKVFKRLTHLILETFKLEDEGVVTNIPCPLLVYLGLHYQALETLSWIDAPNIRELAIQGREYPPPTHLSINPHIVPRVLRLDISHEHEWEGHHLTDPLPNWSELEELHIRLFDTAGDLSPHLIEAMTTTSPDEQMYPKLVSFTVCHNYFNWKDQTTAHKTEKISQLLDIMKERVAAGMPRFSILNFGWHWADDDMPSLSDPSGEWWPTEWTDCLQYVSP